MTDASVGISLAPDDTTDRDQLLKNADLALYAVKANGRGAHRFYEPEISARMKARHELENDIRHVLSRHVAFPRQRPPLPRRPDCYQTGKNTGKPPPTVSKIPVGGTSCAALTGTKSIFEEIVITGNEFAQNRDGQGQGKRESL